MSNSLNVTAGKPRVKGAVYVAPLGSTLPTTALEDLDGAFEELGYISDAGVVNSNSPSNTAVKAWGGDTVLDVQTEKPDTWKMNFIEATNEEVLKVVYGDDNVSGDLEGGLTIKANSKEQACKCFVIDMSLKDGTVKRVILPNAKVTAVGDITYSDSAAVGYDTTLSCYPYEDYNGDTHRELLIAHGDPSF